MVETNGALTAELNDNENNFQAAKQKLFIKKEPNEKNVLFGEIKSIIKPIFYFISLKFGILSNNTIYLLLNPILIYHKNIIKNFVSQKLEELNLINFFI